MGIGAIWNTVILQPVINVLVALSHYLFDNFGFAIIVLTIVIRGAMLPLSLKQIHATKAMQDLQPRLQELQKKCGKDKQKLAQEQMKLYKESGINPVGCMVPMLIQLPVWIALYQSIMLALAVAPEGLLKLSRYLYSWPVVYSMMPLVSQFLWLDLAVPDRYYILALLVGGSMWVQQKMAMTPSTDPQQQAQSRMMLWMMPLMFGFLTMSFPSGLALYWVASNVISIGMQYLVTGWGGLAGTTAERQTGRDKKYKSRIAQVEGKSLGEANIDADIVASDSSQEDGLDDGEPGYERQDRRGSYPERFRPVRRQPRRGKSHRSKRR